MNEVVVFVSICAALGFAAWATMRFVRSFKSKGESLGKRIRRYVREFVDALWGAG